MTAYPNPSRAALVAAFKLHRLTFVEEPIVAAEEGRPWATGLRGIIDHHTAGSDSLALLMNAHGRYPIVNALVSRSGLVHLLSSKSCWGSGDGGPWPGVAGVNSAHLTCWQNEVEDPGTHGKTFTTEQMESLGRLNASLVHLGVPAANEINHRDWTDGNEPVGGHPLPTIGRKSDTRYAGVELRMNTAKYELPVAVKPKPPVYAYRQGKKVYSSKMFHGSMASDSVWNLTLGLRRAGFWSKPPTPNYIQDVVDACSKYQRSLGFTGNGADGIAGPMTVKKLSLVWVQDN